MVLSRLRLFLHSLRCRWLLRLGSLRVGCVPLSTPLHTHWDWTLHAYRAASLSALVCCVWLPRHGTSSRVLFYTLLRHLRRNSPLGALLSCLCLSLPTCRDHAFPHCTRPAAATSRHCYSSLAHVAAALIRTLFPRLRGTACCLACLAVLCHPLPRAHLCSAALCTLPPFFCRTGLSINASLAPLPSAPAILPLFCSPYSCWRCPSVSLTLSPITAPLRT